LLQDGSTAHTPGVSDIVGWFQSLAPAAVTLLLTIVVLAVLHRWLEHRDDSSPGHTVRHQLILLSVTALGLVLVVLMLPISDDLRVKILGLIGIIASSGIALSSTTFLGNMLAGFMLRSVRNFRIGDFISVEDHFGRVSERGLFHVEIQTEERSLTMLPNLYLVRNPVTTVRGSGAIVEASVSLGYDVPRARVSELLLEAARAADLEDPFVTTVALGDFSVTYRVAGLLTEVKSLITARSRLRGKVLDSLHEGGIEIVSPRFINTRALSRDQVFVPQSGSAEPASFAEDGPAPEEILFDKAENAEITQEIELNIDSVTGEIKAVEGELKSTPDVEKQRLEERRRQLEVERERLADELEERLKESESE
jgi:small-conductance mechanosensitive channel